MSQKRRTRPEPAPVPPADFPFRPPTWVRIWAVTLGVVAAAVALVVGLPLAVSGHWLFLLPVVVVVLLAIGLVWRIGGLVTTPTPDGHLLVRNRAKTYRLARADVVSVRAGARSGRAGTPVALLVLTDGTEIAVDATLSAAFQDEQLGAQIAALQAWRRG